MPDLVVIKGVEVERMETYTYLGVIFVKILNCKENTNAIVKTAHTRLYCLRKLRSFDISSQTLQMFFTFAISSVLTFGCVCWSGNVSKQDSGRVDNII